MVSIDGLDRCYSNEHGPRPRPVSGRRAVARAAEGRARRRGARRRGARRTSRGDIARAARRGEARTDANGRRERRGDLISKRASTETERRDDAMARDPREMTGEVARVVIGGDVFQVNDAVLVKAPGANERYVGRIVSVAVENGAVKARLCWYYRPQETRGGRKRFHGVKELFSSDHYDWVSVNTIDAKCEVWSLREYQELEAVTEFDFYARFLYRSSRGEFRPEKVPVFCKCAEPYNPDRFMVECDQCKDWFHPECVDETKSSASQLDVWRCSDCRLSKITGEV